jgi:predicted alpha-1,2-mannosidase
MRGKNHDGSWSKPFDPLAWGNGFVEGNAWHYLWSVQHDVKGLIELLGGRETFIQKLDELFDQSSDFEKGSYKFVIHEMREMKKINMGQYAHNNQPLHHVSYLYNYAGQPWKTQKTIRKLLLEWFRNDLMGVPGDEDGGGMSAFVVFSQMGFYPVTPGDPVYTIGSPVFEQLSLDLANGRVFEIVARNTSAENKYIQSATLNGEALDAPWFDHEDLIRGGKLVLEMGPKASQSWGRGIRTAD